MDRRQHDKAAAEQALAQQQAMEQAAAAAVANMAPVPVAAPVAAPLAAPVAQAAPVDIVSRLQQLGELRQQGLLNDQEFELAKAQLLGN